MLSAIARFDAASTPSPARNLEGSQTTLQQNGKGPSINLLVLDLHRLLHCMEREHNNNNDTDDDTTSNTISWQALGARMELLQSLWQQVQHAVIEAQQQQNSSHGYYQDGEPPSWYRDYEQRVYRSSQKAQEAIHALQRQEAAEAAENAELAILEQDEQGTNNSTTAAPFVFSIGQIFFPQEEQQQEEEEEEEATPVEHDLIGEPMPAQTHFEEEEEDSTQAPSHPPASSFNNRSNHNNNVDIQAFQKEQREQIEQAIALMAAQLKQETENIHSTLKGQTDGLLDEMEDIATRNVEDVTKVTEDVTTHVSDGWKRSLGTISLLLLVASLFLFSLVTIYMIPKYNSPPSAIPPQKLCRQVNGKEECLDLNAWLTGSSDQKDRKDPPKDETSAPYFTTLEDSPSPTETHPTSQEHREAAECELGMDGRCIQQQQSEEDHHLSEEIVHKQQEIEEQLERERLAAEEQKRQQTEGADAKGAAEDLSDEVLAMLAVDLEAEGSVIGDLSDVEIEVMKMELEAQGRLEDDREEKLAREREMLQQQDEQAEPPDTQQVPEEAQHVSIDAGESEFDIAQRREQLLQEREHRENLHNIRQTQGQGSSEQQLLEEREQMKQEYEEQMKRRDEFRETELQQLEEQRRQRELLQEQQRREEEERQRQEALERERQPEQERQQQQQQQQQQEQEQVRQEEEEIIIDLPPPPPSESIAQHFKGFEAFRDEQETNKPPKAQPVAGAGAAMGFGGGFGGGGGAAGEVDPFGAQKAGANPEENAAPVEDPPEPEFRGRPFAPRDIRRAAASGEINLLRDYIDQRPNWVNKGDKNGWGAIHLAVRAGHYGSVEILVNANADINGRTAQGLTPLGMALERLGEDHPVANLLRQHGGQL